ncbi:MAG: DUF4340 domain-containing protein [Planctomycetota bacterium]|nr:DUF4340 domain-containing protein [Planctomycetota bacterium]
MRPTRTNWMLLGLLVLLAALDLGLRDGGGQTRTIGRLASEFYRDRAARALLVRGGEQMELQRGEEAWSLPEHHGYAASARTVDELLTALTSLTTLDLVSLDATTHAEYGLAQDALAIEVWDEEGQRVLGLLQGAEVSGGGASYVRLMGEDAVYRAARLRSIQLDPRFWLDVQWLTYPEALVSRIELSGTALSGPRTLVREADTVDTWRVEGGERVGAAPIKKHLRALRSLFVESVRDRVDAGAPVSAPLLSAELELIDGRHFSASIMADPSGAEGVLGRRGSDDPFIVQFGQSSWQAVLASAERLLE